MNYYHFGGKIVASPAEFPELDLYLGDSQAHWVVQFEPAHLDEFQADSVVRQDGELVVERRDTPNGFIMRFDDNAEYEVDRTASSIRVRHSDSTDVASIRHVVLDSALPRAMSADGSLIVHASGVSFDGRAVLFLGPSGAGKSTISAHSFQDPDARLLGDDCFVVRYGPPTTITSTYRSLRLLPDTLGYLRDGDDDGGISATAMSRSSSKKRVQLGGSTAGSAAVLAAVVMLGSSPGQSATMRELSQRDVVVGLVKNSFRADVTGSASLQTAFDRASSVAEHVRGYQLEYRRDYDELPGVYSLIREALAAADAS